MFQVRPASKACSENKVEDRMMSAALGGGGRQAIKEK